MSSLQNTVIDTIADKIADECILMDEPSPYVYANTTEGSMARKFIVDAEVHARYDVQKNWNSENYPPELRRDLVFAMRKLNAGTTGWKWGQQVWKEMDMCKYHVKSEDKPAPVRPRVEASRERRASSTRGVCLLDVF